MSAAGNPRMDHYDWAGGRETVLRFGPDRGPTVVVALPLLEEANRTRALMVAVLRMLAARGAVGALPELPGMGESLVATENMRLADLRAAFAAAAVHVGDDVRPIAIRSGALFSSVTPDLIRGPASLRDGAKDSGTPAQACPELRRRGRGDESRWHLSPQAGGEVLREWRRLQKTGDGHTVAGNRVASVLWDELATATVPAPARTVRLDSARGRPILSCTPRRRGAARSRMAARRSPPCSPTTSRHGSPVAPTDRL